MPVKKNVLKTPLINWLDKLEGESLRYLTLSVFSCILNVGLAFGLHYAGLSEQLAFAIALVTVFITNFCAFRWIVFQSNQAPLIDQFVKYLVSNGSFRLLEYGVVNLLGIINAGSYHFRVIVVLTGSFCLKYFIYRWLVFRPVLEQDNVQRFDQSQQVNSTPDTSVSTIKSSAMKVPDKQAIWFAVILLVIETVKIGLFIFLLGPQKLRKDTLVYWELGRAVSQGDWFLIENGMAFRPPAYPWFLGSIQTITEPENLLATIFVQGGLVLCTTVLTGYLCWLLTQSNLLTVLALAGSILCIERTWYATALMSETLFLFFLLTHIVFWIRWAQNPSWLLALLAAIPLGLAILTKSVAQYYAIVSIVSMLLLFPTNHHFKQRLPHAAVAFCTVILILLPWYARNYTLFSKPMLTAASGRSLWLSAYKENCGNLPLPKTQHVEELTQSCQQNNRNIRDTWDVYSELRDTGMSEVATDSWMKQAAKDSILAHPMLFIQSVSVRFVKYWVVTEVNNRGQARYQQTAHSLLAYCKNAYRMYSFYLLPLFYGIISLLSIWGFMKYCQLSSIQVGTMLLLTIFYFALVTSVGAQPSYRYHMILEPLQIVGCLVGIKSICNFSTHLQSRAPSS